MHRRGKDGHASLAMHRHGKATAVGTKKRLGCVGNRGAWRVVDSHLGKRIKNMQSILGLPSRFTSRACLSRRRLRAHEDKRGNKPGPKVWGVLDVQRRGRKINSKPCGSRATNLGGAHWCTEEDVVACAYAHPCMQESETELSDAEYIVAQRGFFEQFL